MIGLKIKMPKCCYECPLYERNIYGQGSCFLLSEMILNQDRKDKRHKNCPLVELKGETNELER